MLNRAISQVVWLWAKNVSIAVQTRWGAYSSVEGEAKIDVPTPVLSDTAVVAYIYAKGFKAFALEYGTGSYMDRTSIYLEDYKKSDRWNDKRTDYAFRGRQKGETVIRPDGTTYESSGRLAGRNLEIKQFGLPPFQAQQALHIITEEIYKAMDDLEIAVSQVVSDFVLENMKIDMEVFL